MYGTLYRIFNIKNGKSYIGKTYSGFYTRLQQHISDRNRFSKRPLYRAFNKYGIENFSAEILGEYQEGILEEKEIEFIRLYNSYGSAGYNATLGGEGTRYINVPIESLVEEYRIKGNLTTTAKVFGIDPQSCKKLLESHGEPIVQFDGKAYRRNLYSKKVYIPEVDISFKDPYECARFLMDCDIVPNSSDEVAVAMSVRRVCTSIRKHYLGIYFEYIE